MKKNSGLNKSKAKQDSAGRIFVALPQNVPLDITPQAPGQRYTYSVNPRLIPVTLTANQIDLSTNTPTFCVGQKVTFALNVPAPYVNAQFNWTLPAKFVNSSTTNSKGCIIYTNNGSPYVTTNGPFSCWYVNGSGGTVSVQANIILTDGKTVPVAALGRFAIERPSVSMSQIQEPRFFQITSNTFGGATIKLGTSGATTTGVMAYTVEYDTDVNGLGEITQTCQLSYSPDPGGFNFSDWRLDGSINYEGPQGVIPNTGSIDIGLNDGPQNGTYASQSPIEVKGNFTDYIMFQPTSTAGSIYVTLGIVTWNLDGKIAYQGSPPSWQFVITNTPDPVGPNNSDAFPFYTQPQ